MTRTVQDLERARRRFVQQLACDPVVLDRVAWALGVRDDAVGPPGLAPHPQLDALRGGPVQPALEDPVDPALRLSGGYDRLVARVEEAGDDLIAAIAAIVIETNARGRSRSSDRRGIVIPVGRAGDRPIEFTLNLEADRQTNGNTRITGQPGMGKSQFLLHLLASVAARAPDCGFVLLDYKGDLSDDAGFVQATGARVVQPEREAVPVNPFEVPRGLDRRLIPSALAALLASLGRSVGDTQRKLLRDGIGAAFEAAAPDSPSTVEIAQHVHDVYEEEGRPTDSVTGLLEELAGLGLFATRSRLSVDEFLRGRWIINLSRLQNLRDLVAFVLVDWLNRNVQSLDDAPLLDARHRALRCIVAIDEAHHYVSKRCQPLLELLRIGRSKGTPVVLSSQSLADFKAFTELEELLPNNFVLRHGMAPDRRTVQGALRLSGDRGRTALDVLTDLPQFHALTAVDPEVGLDPVRLHGFFQGAWRP